jgi:hypothetical protein
MAGRPVGYLAYASVANMKVRGTLGNEGSIVVQPAPAVAKSASAVPVGLLALGRWACTFSPRFFLVLFLTGPIPDALGKCIKLTGLDFGRNQLTGKCSIPHTLLPRKVTSLFFLTGAIPVTLGNCINLVHLYLSSNKLTGKCMIHHSILP